MLPRTIMVSNHRFILKLQHVLCFNGVKVNAVLCQMHLTSLTEIPNHWVFTDPRIIDYCNEKKWK